MEFDTDGFIDRAVIARIKAIIKAFHKDLDDKEDLERITQLLQEIVHLIAEARKDCDSRGRAMFIFKLTRALKKFGTPEEKIYDIVREMTRFLS